MNKRARERFLDKIEITPSGCWIWTAATNDNGYAVFSVDGHSCLAHRWAFEEFIGPIPDRLELDHGCRVRACVNPLHAEPVTHLENCGRGSYRQRTHCKHGHEYTSENTFVNRAGGRICRTCRRAARRRWVAKTKVAV